jgi:uncharacterized protein (DUF58 family)
MKQRLIPFAILAFLSLLTGYVTGNNIYYIVFYTFIFVALLSLISLIINYSQFNYLQKVTPKQGVKGETVNLDMQVHNDFIVPLPMVDIEYDLPDDSLNLYANSARFGVPGRDKVSINQNVFCKYRGKWRVGIKKARIYDMFGLFHITLDFYKNPNYRTQSLIIAPRIVNLDFLPLPFKENASSQNPIQKITSDTAETSDIRAYINGDILKKIHWKLSLAKQELMVKNHSLSLEPDTLIYVDCSSHGFTGIKAIELEDMIAECATAVSNYLLQSYLAAKFVMVGKERTELIGRSPEDFNAVYENISNLTFDYDFSFFDLFADELSAIAHVNSIFIITHSITPKGFDSLVYLREASINITLILVEEGKTAGEENLKNMITELKSVGTVVICLSPGDDLNMSIKEQANEKTPY